MNDQGYSTVFEELLKRLANAFAKNAIPYMVIGGQAVLLYGEPRLTKDIDITLGIAPNDGAPVIELLAGLGFTILIENPLEFLAETFVVPVQDSKSDIRVDLVFSLSEYERGAIERAISVNISGQEVKFISLEDLIIHKVVAGRPRDLEDATVILTKHPEADLTTICKWLDEYDRELSTDFHFRLDQILKNIISD